ncbi:hypothetical protein [Engelhardtia mirabilis]|uniref:Uncharacterized protein n=1 Tax=Engelhardtia mirabilis TaxID=2528011 RepID=A0A518BDF4_9BACT|nr:hypothetical protein Pla133_00800 [Planctomycetes bacterium Pla133]QDU99343.1 hypothetical protein Pla86_00800 [Planctomycetes bacterium Pla86]
MQTRITGSRTLAATLSLATVAGIAASASAGTGGACEGVAFQAHLGALAELQSDFYLAYGKCLNQTDLASQNECLAQALAELQGGLELADSQFDARVELCGELGGGAFAPAIDPDDFSSTVDHLYYPLVAGTVKTFMADTDEGVETIVITVTGATREIMGVECREVHDLVTLADPESGEQQVIEDTLDYYAQDKDGNVWYFGELALNYEDGYLANIDGSWFAGVDGAEPGIVMLATPSVGEVYRQEFLLGEAEDAAKVLGTADRASVPAGDFTGCVRTADFTPIEPTGLEHKYYAPGLGAVLEIKPGTGERLELISVVAP